VGIFNGLFLLSAFSSVPYGGVGGGIDLFIYIVSVLVLFISLIPPLRGGIICCCF